MENLKFKFLTFSILLTYTVAWKQRELVFKLEGRNVAGLPSLKEQYSGIDFNGTLHMQTQDASTFVLKFSNMMFRKLHGDFENGWWDTGVDQTSENLEVKSNKFPISTLPFIIQLQKNVVKKIVVASSLKDWELNFIKGIVNKLVLSIDVNKDSGISFDNSVGKSKASSGEKFINSYTTMEESVVGRCEVQYDIVKIPLNAQSLYDSWNHPAKKAVCLRKSLYEVSKTYNYSNCEFLTETHFNFPSGKADQNCKPGSNSCENFWKRSTLTKTIGCGDPTGFFVLQSVTASTFSANVHVHEESQAVVQTRLIINLSEVLSEHYESFKTDMPKDVKNVQDFTYTYTPKKWDSSQSCNSDVRERISGKTEESKKISELIFKDYNAKSKMNDILRTKRSKGSKGKKHQSSYSKDDDNENKSDQDEINKGYYDDNKNNYNNNNFDDNYKNTAGAFNEDVYLDDKNYNQGNKRPGSNGYLKNSFDNKNKDNSNQNYKNDNSNFFDSERNNFYNFKNKGNDFNDSNGNGSERPENNYNDRKYKGNHEDNYGKNGYDNINNGFKNKYSSGERSEKNNIWNPVPAGMHDPPFMPLTPFALAYKENDARNCLQQIFKDMIEQISYDFINKNVPVEEGTMEKISIAIDMCKIMSFKELSLVSDSLFYGSPTNHTFSDKSTAERKLFRDIISACGTKPALSLINKWIDDNQLLDYESAVIFTTLPARLVSADVKTVNFYFELVKKVMGTKNEKMATGAVIGFSNFVRISCVERKMNHFNPQIEELCDSRNAEIYVDWMANKLRDHNKKMKMFRVLILAIGNTGTKHAFKVLKTVANNQNLSSYQRSHAINAMKYLVMLYPRYTETVLHSLYSNYSAPVSVRITALSSLIFSKPSLSVWQRIALSTWYEPNLAVISFVQSTIESLSEAYEEHPKIHVEMTHSAKLVKHLMRPKVTYPRKPAVFNILESTYMKEMESDVFEHSTWTGSSDLLSIYHRHYSHTNAFSSGFEAELTTANPDNLLNALKLILFPPHGDITRYRPPIQNLTRSTSFIHNVLGLTARKPSPLEGDIRFKLNNLIEAIVPFNQESTVSFTDWGRKFFSELRQEGLKTHIQKVDMSSSVLSTTTELGFPVRLQMHIPWVLQSKAAMNLIDRNTLAMTFSLKLSSGMNGELSFFTPWDNTAYIAGIYGSCFGQIPKIKLIVKLNRETSSLAIKSEAIDNSKLLFHSTYPFTSQKDLVLDQLTTTSSETRIVHVDKMKQRNLNPHEHLKGIYRTEGKMYSNFELLNQGRVHHHPLMWHSNKLTHIEIGLNGMGATVFNFTLERATVEDGNIIVHSAEDDAGSTRQNNKSRKLVTRSIWSDFLSWFGHNETTEAPSTASTPTSATDSTPASEPDVSETTVTESSPLEHRSIASFTSKFGSHDELRYEKLKYENNPERFKASTLNPFVNQVNGNSYLYIISRMLDGMKSGHGFLIGMNATVHKTDGGAIDYSSFWAYGATNSKSLQRVTYFTTTNASNSQIGITATLEMPPVPAFDVEKVTKSRSKPKFTVDYIQQLDQNNLSLLFEGEIEQIASVLDLKDEIIHCRRSESAATSKCRRIHDFITSFNEIKLNVSLNNENDSFKRDIEWLAALTAIGGKDFLEQQHFKPKGSSDSDSSKALKMSLSFSEDFNYWNGWINTSAVDSNFKKIRLPHRSMVSTAVSLYGELTQTNSQYCSIRHNKLITFDGLELNYNLTDCWHVAVKDCSGKSRFVLLARLLQNSSAMEIEMNLDNYKIVKISDGIIKVNDEDVTLSDDKEVAVSLDKAGTVLVRIEKTVENALEITVPAHGFKLLHTNVAVVIYGYSGMQSRLCGLCGDYNLETFGELQNPKGTIVNSALQFGASYAINDKTCVKQI